MTSPTAASDHGLGRIYAPDDRDHYYPLRSFMAAFPVPLPSSRLWTPGPILDQGSHPYCVGFGCRDWLSAEPNSDHRKSPLPTTLYKAAQKLDGMPMPHDGSSVRAGLQALQSLKRVHSYHWAIEITDVRDYVLGYGCVILGVSWFSDMFHPDKTGLIQVGGSLAGGHCLLCIGYNTASDLFTLQNSWGAGFGRGGLCDISGADLSRLLAEQGEAAAALEHA